MSKWALISVWWWLLEHSSMSANSRCRAAKSKCHPWSSAQLLGNFSQNMYFLHILAQVHILKVKPRLFLIGKFKQQGWITGQQQHMNGTSEISVPFRNNCNALRAQETMTYKVWTCRLWLLHWDCLRGIVCREMEVLKRRDEHVRLVTCSANTTNARKRIHIKNEYGINQKITSTGGL